MTDTKTLPAPAPIVNAETKHFWDATQEGKLLLSLQRSYRDLIQFREEVVTRHSQREAAATQVRARFAKFKAGDRDTSIDLFHSLLGAVLSFIVFLGYVRWVYPWIMKARPRRRMA